MESRTKTPKQTWSYYGIFGIFIRSLAGTQNNENAKPADIAIPDGIGILGAKILRDAVYCQNYWLKIIEAYWQAIASLFSCPL